VPLRLRVKSLKPLSHAKTPSTQRGFLFLNIKMLFFAAFACPACPVKPQTRLTGVKSLPISLGCLCVRHLADFGLGLKSAGFNNSKESFAPLRESSCRKQPWAEIGKWLPLSSEEGFPSTQNLNLQSLFSLKRKKDGIDLPFLSPSLSYGAAHPGSEIGYDLDFIPVVSKPLHVRLDSLLELYEGLVPDKLLRLFDRGKQPRLRVPPAPARNLPKPAQGQNR